MSRFYDMGNAGWYALELLVGLAIIAIAYGAGDRMRTFWAWAWQALTAFAQSRRWAYGIAAGWTLVACLALTLRFGPPVPRIHDEFSYLLGAETLAQFRLANSPPPHPEFFESFHINVGPTYHSKYPIGQALVLAWGLWLTGQAIAGVWISMTLAAVSLLWMLRGWVPDRWAFVGTLYTMTRLALYPVSGGTWSYSYWGGAVALIGGCLLWGAIGRLRVLTRCGRNSLSDLGRRGKGEMSGSVGSSRSSLTRTLHWRMMAVAVGLGAGLVVLAFSRLYEGLLCAIPAAFWLAGDFLRSRQKKVWTRRVAIPIAVCLGLGAAAWAQINRATTGQEMQLAYLAHGQTYSPVPLFNFQELKAAKPYRHPEMERFYTIEDVRQWNHQQTWRGWMGSVGDRWLAILCLYAGGLGAVPWLLGVGQVLRSRRARWVVGSVFFVLAGMSFSTFFNVAYLAPLGGLSSLVFVLGWRQTSRWFGRTKLAGGCLPASGLAAHVVLGLIVIILFQPNHNDWSRQREAMKRHLESQGGRHLVVVRYQPDHNVHEEWVYNGANWQTAPVVWARDSGADRNQILFDAFPSHSVWLLDADSPQRTLCPLETERQMDLGNRQVAR